MILIVIPGVIALLSIFILVLNEIRNQRIFEKMPRIRSEKREELCREMLPFLAPAETKNKALAEKMGWSLSGIFMGYLRIMVLLLSFSLGGLVIGTNTAILRSEIIENMNIGKSFIELQNCGKPSLGAVREEANKIKKLENQIPTTLIKRGGPELLNGILAIQKKWGTLDSESQSIENKRLAIKLVSLHKIKYGKRPWIGLMLLSLILYLMPIPLCWIKESLLEQKKREEIIGLYETMLLYGELPPYEIRSLLANMLNTAVLYKAELNKVMEGIKTGYSEGILTEAIERAILEKDWDLADLLEHLKSFYRTGILSKSKDFERIIERKTKMEEIYMEKKRGGKVQLASIPLGIIIGLGTWYFMLGTMSLSNMSILGH